MGIKLNYIDVKNYIESFGYKWLSGEYKDNKSKLNIQCPEEHIYNVSYAGFQQGDRCSECSGKKRHTLKEIKDYIERYDYKLLSVEYKDNKSLLDIKCPEGHVSSIRYNDFQQGHRCLKCSGKRKYTLEEVKEYVENFGYKVISVEYKNALSDLRLECPKGHNFNMRFNSFQQGQRCPKCSYINKSSKPEKEIAEYVKTIYSGKIIENDRAQVKNYWSSRNLELDIFLPELSKAIEFNGIYWHSSDKNKWYDEMKKKQCIQKGIDLFVIDEKHWRDDKVCCLSNITKFIM